MINHFFKIAFRHAAKYKGYTFITIAGMALGLACSIIILLSVYDQLTFDNFHLKKDRIYQVQQTVKFESGEYTSDRTGGAFAQSLLENFPEIVNVTRLGNAGELLIMKPEVDSTPESYIEENIWAADSTFFEIFSFEFILGNPTSALDDPGSVVLNSIVAEKYFGSNWRDGMDILGSRLMIDNSFDLQVTGVVEIPHNSHIQFDLLLAFPLMPELGYYIEGFEGTMYHTYLLLNRNASADNINLKISDYIQSQFEPILESKQFIVPLSRVYLYGESRNFMAVYSFAAIAIMILLIACINYINLSTAMSINRTTEVGIRKVEGAGRNKLAIQYLGEAFITIFISTQLAIILVELFIPEYNRLTQSNLYLDYFDPKFIIGVGILVSITTLLAGLYPAIVLSSFSPARLLRQKSIGSRKGEFLRKSLVVIQFTFTSFFLITTVIMIRQFSFMDSADPGFDESNVIFMPVRGEAYQKFDLIKQELQRSSRITSITSASDIPSFVEHGEVGWGVTDINNSTLARVLFVGHDFDKTFDIGMEKGRFFSEDYPADSSSIIVNQEVLNVLQIEDPIGAEFHLWDNTYTIVGVIENFSFFPFTIGGDALLMPFHRVEDLIFVKIVPGNPKPAINHIKSVMAEFNPDFPFEYHFLENYSPEILSQSGVINRLMIYSNVFGIFISCLGLLGLATFTAEQKQKEIGIRKVFGASTSRITYLLSSSFIKLVILANLIAIPFAWLAMNATLSFFVQRIELSPVIFFLVLLFTVLMAMITVSWKSIRTAAQNPIDSLHYE
jgi:ABC-type antimicrobial peptide transport system permease subunit